MNREIIRGAVIACTAFASGVGLGYLLGKKSAQRGTVGPQRGYSNEADVDSSNFDDISVDGRMHLPEIPDGVNVVEDEDGVKVYSTMNDKPGLEEIAGQYLTIDGLHDRAGGRNKTDVDKLRYDALASGAAPVRCTEQDYVGTYADYEHHTVTWYKINDVLYDEDDEQQLVTPEEKIEKLGPWAVDEIDEFEMENVDGTMYVVDERNHICYEIIMDDETDYGDILEAEAEANEEMSADDGA